MHVPVKKKLTTIYKLEFHCFSSIYLEGELRRTCGITNINFEGNTEYRRKQKNLPITLKLLWASGIRAIIKCMVKDTRVRRRERARNSKWYIKIFFLQTTHASSWLRVLNVIVPRCNKTWLCYISKPITFQINWKVFIYCLERVFKPAYNRVWVSSPHHLARYQ